MEEKKVEQEEGLTYKKILLEIWSWVYNIVFAVVLVLLIKNLLFSMTIVKKTSMYPTIQENNALLVDRLSQVRGVPLERGDIVVFEAPEGLAGDNIAYYSENSTLDKFRKLFVKTLYVKRVIAVAGDQVTIEKGILYINGEAQDEAYVNPDNDRNGSNLSLVVPEGYIFCMGDNRGSSYDCRNFGCVPLDKVEGQAIFRFFPFNQIGSI